MRMEFVFKAHAGEKVQHVGEKNSFKVHEENKLLQ